MKKELLNENQEPLELTANEKHELSDEDGKIVYALIKEKPSASPMLTDTERAIARTKHGKTIYKKWLAFINKAYNEGAYIHINLLRFANFGTHLIANYSPGYTLVTSFGKQSGILKYNLDHVAFVPRDLAKRINTYQKFMNSGNKDRGAKMILLKALSKTYINECHSRRGNLIKQVKPLTDYIIGISEEASPEKKDKV